MHGEKSADLSTQYSAQLTEIFDKFPTVFSDKVGLCDYVVHSIDTYPDARPVRTPPYRLTPAKRDSLVTQIDEMLSLGIIVHSKSDWCSSPVMVLKSDGISYRMAIDYRPLNKVTIPDSYPLPTAQQLLSTFHGSKVYSTLDLRSAFHQTPLKLSDQPKTAFAVAGLGLFHFSRLSFGLRNASSAFQRTMDVVMVKQTGRNTAHFIDDICVFSKSPEDHLEDLEETLDTLRRAGLTVNKKKCNFMKSEVRFLGYIVSERGIEIDPDKFRAISEFPRPHDLKSLMRFLGLCSWLHNFIPSMAEICEPLNNLKRKGVPFVWSEDCETAFNKLKAMIVNSVALSIPDESLPYEIHCDSSGIGIGAALVQIVNGKRKVIQFASRPLTRAERNWSVTEMELMAIIWSLEHWSEYLRPDLKTTVYSDHRCLQWLYDQRDLRGRLARWVLRLQAFNFEVKYRLGSEMILPDSLSRAPVSQLAQLEIVDQQSECYADTCICPPEQELADWIQCDNCDLWYHQQCVNNLPDGPLPDTYFCPKCPHPEPVDPEPSTPAPASFTIPDKDAFIHQQAADPQLAKMIAILKKKNNSKKTRKAKQSLKKTFELKEELLVNKSPSGIRVVVPQTLVNCVISNYHDRPSAGHLCARKTISRISDKYWWFGMKKSVDRYVKCCRACQVSKPRYAKPKGFMATTTSTQCFEVLSADFMGPLVKTDSGYQYLLVLTDHFSKFVLMFPIKNANSRVLRSLVNWCFCTFGPSQRFHSDNGPQFVASRFVNLLKDWGVQQSFSARFHPQSNFTERVNRNIKSMLTCFHREDHTEWHRFIPEFQFALNSVVHDTTKMSPAAVFFRRQFQQPGDSAVLSFPPHHAVDVSPVEENARVMAQENEERYNKTRNPASVFEENQLVLLKNFPKSSAARKKCAKLLPKFLGPFKIVRRLSPLNYEICELDGRESKVRVAHVEQLELYNM